MRICYHKKTKTIIKFINQRGKLYIYSKYNTSRKCSIIESYFSPNLNVEKKKLSRYLPVLLISKSSKYFTYKINTSSDGVVTVVVIVHPQQFGRLLFHPKLLPEYFRSNCPNSKTENSRRFQNGNERLDFRKLITQHLILK